MIMVEDKRNINNKTYMYAWTFSYYLGRGYISKLREHLLEFLIINAIYHQDSSSTDSLLEISQTGLPSRAQTSFSALALSLSQTSSVPSQGRS